MTRGHHLAGHSMTQRQGQLQESSRLKKQRSSCSKLKAPSLLRPPRRNSAVPHQLWNLEASASASTAATTLAGSCGLFSLGSKSMASQAQDQISHPKFSNELGVRSLASPLPTSRIRSSVTSARDSFAERVLSRIGRCAQKCMEEKVLLDIYLDFATDRSRSSIVAAAKRNSTAVLPVIVETKGFGTKSPELTSVEAYSRAYLYCLRSQNCQGSKALCCDEGMPFQCSGSGLDT